MTNKVKSLRDACVAARDIYIESYFGNKDVRPYHKAKYIKASNAYHLELEKTRQENSDD